MQSILKGVNYTELRYIFKHLLAGTQMLVDTKSVVSCQCSTEFDDNISERPLCIFLIIMWHCSWRRIF